MPDERPFNVIEREQQTYVVNRSGKLFGSLQVCVCVMDECGSSVLCS